MKSRLVLDQYCNPANVTEAMRPKMLFKPHPKTKQPEAYFPAGTEFEGEQAVFLCRTGQAEPSDDECGDAINATPAERERAQRNYVMNTLGINRKEDRELYEAGVIVGYDPKKDMAYIPGPNWDAYQAAMAESEAIDDGLGIEEPEDTE